MEQELYDKIVDGIDIVGNASDEEILEYENVQAKLHKKIRGFDITSRYMAEYKIGNSIREGKNFLNSAEVVSILKLYELRFIQLEGNLNKLVEVLIDIKNSKKE